MALIGYARVSAEDQLAARQRDELRATALSCLDAGPAAPEHDPQRMPMSKTITSSSRH